MLVYDIEIINAIPPRKGENRVEGITYCEGWHDHANMGVACICAYDFVDHRFRVFTEGNFSEFDRLASERMVAGFNSISFDDKVVWELNLADEVRTEYDLLRECWIADGLSPEFEYPSHTGYGLDALAKANNLTGKTGHGAVAPVEWQLGCYGKVIDYCLEDVRLTAALIQHLMRGGQLVSPKTGHAFKRPVAEPDWPPPGGLV